MQFRGNVFRVIFILVLAVLSFWIFLNPKKTETNILKAILSDNEQDTLLVDLSNKQAGKINVVFESTDEEILPVISKSFFEKLDKDVFYTNEVNVNEILDTYKKYHNSLLSRKTALLLENKEYETVKNQAFERLYNPVGITLLSLDDDPFLLFTDYIQSFGSGGESSVLEAEGKYYESFEFFIKKDAALSPTLLNAEMKKLIALKDTMCDENSKIYLAGAPVHTYYASSKSMKEINIICILSSLFVIFLCKFYFKSFKILLPVLLSLALGMFCGYLVTSLIFDSIHILTFVFASTLIGICVDYSLHYFAHNNDLNEILKSLTQSLLTTVCAFLILLLSDIELLKQISIFTVTGLVTVYLFVVLFYPLICKNINIPNVKAFNPLQLNGKSKAVIYLFFAIVIIYGMFNIKFNDEIKDMYMPPKELAYAETLYSKISQKDFNYSFIIVKADNLQQLLQKEEEIIKKLAIEDSEYYALSKFVPSFKKQIQNQTLIKELYKSELKSFGSFLPISGINKLLKSDIKHDYLVPEVVKMPVINDFLLSSTTSVIAVNADIETTHIDDAYIVNLKKDISEKVKNCRLACLILFVPAILVLFFILSFVYKPSIALKITAPSFFGALFAMGLLGVFHQSANLFHVLAMFLIIGFSVDYSIFRFNGQSDSNSEAAVLISCATSAFSFFLLSLTSFKLISSLGFVLCAGLLSSYILSVLLISHSSSLQTDKE